MLIVQFEVERCEGELASIKNTGIRQLRVIHFFDDFRWNFLRWIAVIGRKRIEHFLVPDPILQHLRWRFYEIPRHMRSGETAVLRASDNRMKRVTEFVEQSFDFLVCHQRRLVRCRRRKIAKQGDSWPLVFSVRQQFASDDFELGEVIEFSFARKHIEIKHPERLAGGGIGHHVELEIVDPFVRRSDLLKRQTKDALIYIEHAVEHLWNGKYARNASLSTAYFCLSRWLA